VARWLLGRQKWSPMDPTPVEFVKLNYDFHPAWMWKQFVDARLNVREQLAVSHFRTPLLKRTVPAAFLAKVDSWFFGAGGRYPLAPSVFVQVEAEQKSGEPNPHRDSADLDLADLTSLFSCPACGEERTLQVERETQLSCQSCSKQYVKHDGIWDFKEGLD